MRIIKLGTGEFPTFDKVEDYFYVKLLKEERDPKGKFRLPNGNLISEKGLSVNEPILFSYKKVVCFTATAKTGRLDNHDKHAEEYPYYFVIDMSSLQSANISLEEVEDSLRDVLDGKSLVSARSWIKIEDSSKTDELWESIRK